MRKVVLKYAILYCIFVATIFLINIIVENGYYKKSELQKLYHQLFKVETMETKLSAQLLKELRLGGHTIFMRHSRRDQTDESGEFLDRLALLTDYEHPPYRQGICLNELGELEARTLGEIFQTLAIPVGMIFSSPTCRTMATAKLAFGRVDRVERSLLALDFFAAETSTMRRQALEILHTPPEPGKNKIVISHAPVLPSLGWSQAKLQQSGSFIFKHLTSGDLQPVISIDLIEWMKHMPAAQAH